MTTPESGDSSIGRNIVRLASVDSTNAEARRMAGDGAAHGTVIVAASQGAGRGRRGRTWSSPAAGNIYMSIILRPSNTTALRTAPGLVPLAAGLAAVSAIRESALPETSLKWPNDIIARGGKLGGILLEARTGSQGMDHAVLGIGINANSSAEDFPEDIRPASTSLLMETGRETDIDALVKEIIRWLSITLGPLSTGDGQRAMLNQYRAACSTLGQKIRAEAPSGATEGIAMEVDEEGRLVMETSSGRIAISAADIIHIRPGG